MRHVTEEFITAYQDSAVYTLQTLCAKDAAATFDMTGEIHTRKVSEMVRASGQRSSLEILAVTHSRS